ncbi:ion-transport peptide precursor [Anopheles sinensis]|uniref:Ion-transport peptide n=1 Tax=Anopheles sinensis TaxID=74873 RepID=A0A084WCT6_ANOSI|nr:ion-transport peptide precursor [Anopheles sinensis]
MPVEEDCAVSRSGSLGPAARGQTEGCFGTDYFLACVEALFLEEEKEKFMKWREMLGKK